MCGIIALLLADKTAHCRQEIFDGLTVLQHRGQDAAGIVTAWISESTTKYRMHKDTGLAKDVFTHENMNKLVGNSGLGHVRYPTAGTMSSDEAQPMYINYPCGLASGHNGNLTNNDELADWLQSQHRHLNTSSDSEVLLNVFAEKLRSELDIRKCARSEKISPEMIMTAVKRTMQVCRGGYSVVMLVHDVGVLAFRDPFGIRPLVYGTRDSKTLEGGRDYCMASESVAFDILGFNLVRDVKPGECVLALPMIPGQPRENLGFFCEQLVSTSPGVPREITGSYPCLFEYVYLARPDSILNGVSVYHARKHMGVKLAKHVLGSFEEGQMDIDVVIPVPETSRTTALTCAAEMKLPYCEGFIKNRYIARTFIMPGQAQRKKSIRLKLNTIRSEFIGRNVLLVDDSVVRGNTSQQLIALAREAGAKKVYFASAAPRIQHPNVYGIDLPTRGELIAYNRSEEEIAENLGCERIFFQDQADLEEAVRLGKVLETEGMNHIEGFDGSPFTGKYLTQDIDEAYFQKMEQRRSDSEKQKQL